MSELLPPQEVRAIAALDEAVAAIERARDVGDVDALLEWRDRAAAVKLYADRRDGARKVADDAGEVKLHAERALGALDRQVNPDRSGGRGKTAAPTTAVSEHTRANWRKLGALDRDTFEGVVERLRADESGGVTTSRAVRVAREFAPTRPKSRMSAHERRMREADELAVRLRRMADDALWLRDNAAKRFGYVRGATAADRLRDLLDRIDERLMAVHEVLDRDYTEFRKHKEESAR